MQWNLGKERLTVQGYKPCRCFVSLTSLWMRCVLILCGLVFHTAVLAQDIGVRAELSAPAITIGDSVSLTVTAFGIDAELDASSLERDFDVVGRSSSQQVRTTIGANNRAVSTKVLTWSLELSPRSVGVFTVPSVSVGDYETQLLSLSVDEVPSGAKRDLFVEVEVDTTTPWVQSQVVMTIKIYDGLGMVGGGLDSPTANDLVVERLGDDNVRMVTVDGREYKLTERRFALFAQKSGFLTIDPVTLQASVPKDPSRRRSIFGSTVTLTRSSEPVILDVQARPLAGTGWWLPAANVWVRSEWKGEPNEAEVDKPLTRTLIIRAEGVLSSQLPEFNLPAIDGLSVYAEEPKRGMGSVESGLVTEQRIDWALIPQRSGTMTLPAIRFEWFNTRTGETEVAELAEETINVLAASADAATVQSPAQTDTDIATPAPPADLSDTTLAALSDSTATNAPDASEQLLTGESNELAASNLPLAVNAVNLEGLQNSIRRWQLLAGAACALWLMTLLAWFAMRRHPSTASTDTLVDKKVKGAASANFQLLPMKQVDKACKKGDLPAIKQALLEWAALQWPDQSINTLDGLQRKLPAGAASDKLSLVQSALYSKRDNSPDKSARSKDMAVFPAELRAALQKKNTVASKKGQSRLPAL